MVFLAPYDIELVPATTQGRSLAALALQSPEFAQRWHQIKSREFDRASYKCEFCGADGRLDCNERWDYDDANRRQRLVGYAVVCPECNLVLHIDRAIQRGGIEVAVDRFTRVTGLTEEDLREATSDALRKWRERSQYEWTVDVSGEPLARGFQDALNPWLPSQRAAPAPRRKAVQATSSLRPKVGSEPAKLDVKRARSVRPNRVKAASPPAKPTQYQTPLSDEEISFLRNQRLARIATTSERGVPEVSPVGFEFDGRFFWVGSQDQKLFFKTQRYKNITRGNKRVALVIDDLQSMAPWKPRGIKVSGTAEVADHVGPFGKGKYLRISPAVTVSWGLEKPKKGESTSRKVHGPEAAVSR